MAIFGMNENLAEKGLKCVRVEVGNTCYRVIREGFFGKMTYEQRPNYTDILGRGNVPGGEVSTCKGYEVSLCLKQQSDQCG